MGGGVVLIFHPFCPRLQIRWQTMTHTWQYWGRGKLPCEGSKSGTWSYLGVQDEMFLFLAVKVSFAFEEIMNFMFICMSTSFPGLACERRRIFSVTGSAETNVCEPELENDFCDVTTFFSRWPIIVHDRMYLEYSSQLLARQLSSSSTLSAIAVELYTPDSHEYLAR